MSEPATTPVQGDAYGAVAVGFHWLLALAIVASFSVGLTMSDMALSPLRIKLFNWHKWAGITILALSAARLLWRLANPPPPLAPTLRAAMPAWQLSTRRHTHALLYVFFFAVPLSGWAYSSAIGFPIVWFGVLPLPDWIGVDKSFGNETLKPLHQSLAFGLAGLVVLHLLGVVKHQLVDGDGVFRRMWPWSAKR